LLIEIVATTLFSARAGRVEEIQEVFEWLEETLGGQGTGLQLEKGYRGLSLQFAGYLRFRKALRRLDQVIYGIISERRSRAKDTGDLLSMLLRFQDEDGNPMSEKQLRDEVVAMFFAGYETQASSLCWTWYLLSQHPEIEEKLLGELQELPGDRVPTVEDLSELRYTEMIVKESLRLYPPAWSIGREAKEECEIGGYRVPSGTQVMMAQWVTHRDPRYFEDPEVFRPGRWEDQFAKRIPHYAYFPFGKGPRLCIGHSFGMIGATLLLATVTRKFRLQLVPGHRVIAQPGITLRPAGEMRMILKERSLER